MTSHHEIVLGPFIGRSVLVSPLSPTCGLVPSRLWLTAAAGWLAASAPLIVCRLPPFSSIPGCSRLLASLSKARRPSLLSWGCPLFLGMGPSQDFTRTMTLGKINRLALASELKREQPGISPFRDSKLGPPRLSPLLSPNQYIPKAPATKIGSLGFISPSQTQ